MVSIFRKIRVRYLFNGKRVSAAEAKRLRVEGQHVAKQQERCRIWYIRVRLPDGSLAEFRGFTDKAATLAKARELEATAAREAAGLIRPSDRYQGDPIGRHLEDYTADLQARGRTPKHSRLIATRINRLCEAGGIRLLRDLTAERIATALGTLRREGLGAQTIAHYVAAVRAFSRRLWRNKRLDELPTAGLGCQSPDSDRRYLRRALTPQELAKLIEAAEQSPWTFRGLSGPDRAALYLLAAASSLRAGELAQVTAGDLNLTEPPYTVRLRGRHAKNRRDAVLPLPSSVADYLRRWLSSKSTRPIGEACLWPGTWKDKAAAMLKRDLQAAGAAPESGEAVIDFHALRYTFATNLARVGVPLQVAQHLLRHCDPRLTTRIYTHLGLCDLKDAVAGLDSLIFPQLPSRSQDSDSTQSV